MKIPGNLFNVDTDVFTVFAGSHYPKRLITGKAELILPLQKKLCGKMQKYLDIVIKMSIL